MNWTLYGITVFLILLNLGLRHWLIKETRKMAVEPTEERIDRVQRLIYVGKVVVAFTILGLVGLLINLYQIVTK